MPEIIPATLPLRGKDITGEKFGRLTAIRYVGYVLWPPRYKMSVWAFRCECGTEIIRYSCHARTGNVKSCGCLLREMYVKLATGSMTPHQAYEKHREQRLKDAAAYRLKYKDRIKAYQKNNLERARLSEAAKRARVRASTVNPKGILRWLKRIKANEHLKCYYCQEVIKRGELHIDHIIPLKNSGPHSIENLAASCMWCNHTKSARTLKEWSPPGNQLLLIL